MASSAVACMVWPSCHRNSRWRRKGRLVFSQRSTLHHWLYSLGRSRQEWMMLEGTAGLLPAQHAAPLVVQLGQIPPGVDDVPVVLAEQGLAGGPDAQPLLQLLAAAGGHPGALGGKALHVVLLLLEEALGDQHGHVHVLVAGLLELVVQHPLDVLPDGVAVGAVDEDALDAGVVDELRLGAHVGEPLGKIHVPGGDGLHLLFINILSISVMRPGGTLLYRIFIVSAPAGNVKETLPKAADLW